MISNVFSLAFYILYLGNAYYGFVHNIPEARDNVYFFWMFSVAVIGFLGFVNLAPYRWEIWRKSLIQANLTFTKWETAKTWAIYGFMVAIMYCSGHLNALFVYLTLCTSAWVAILLTRKHQTFLRSLCAPTHLNGAPIVDVKKNWRGVYE